MQNFLSGRKRVGDRSQESKKKSKDFVPLNSSMTPNQDNPIEADAGSDPSLSEENPIKEISQDKQEDRVELSTDDGSYKVEVVSIEGCVDRVIINCPEGKKLVLECEYD